MIVTIKAMRGIVFQNAGVFERVVYDAGGRAFRLRFAVFERGGVLRGRIISCVRMPVPSLVEEGCPSLVLEKLGRGGVVCLLAGKTATPYFLKQPRAHGVIPSPYFHNFDFLTAIKIRAPSFSLS